MSHLRRSLRSAPAGLAFLLALAHCSSGPGASSGSTGSGGGNGHNLVGAPCVPRDESDPLFSGFRVNEESIETNAPECGGDVCLVNHFQGRVSCPLGQAAHTEHCNPVGNSCSGGAFCVEAERLAPACSCDATKAGDCSNACAGVSGSVCDPVLKQCTCTADASINGTDYFCEPAAPVCTTPQCARVLKSFVCHKPGSCQAAGLPVGANLDQGTPKDCCIPGSDRPVEAPACGQCAPQSHRNADSAVYCSCRCGPPDGVTADPADTFCGCPAGFTCSEIREDLGIGDPHLAGKYCIKEGSAFTGNSASCGQVSGNADPTMCAGVGAGGP